MIGITKSEFENSLLREDVVEYYLNMPLETVNYKFGDMVADMVGYNQNNPNHCYDLLEHTLRTVIDIPTGELTNEDVKILKIAAFLHDVGKPSTAKESNGKVVYVGSEKVSSKMAREFLQELGYDESDILKICFFIEHINDFLYYKDDIPYYYEHHAYVKKISAKTVAEQLLENEYAFRRAGLSRIQIKAVCHYLINDEEWPFFQNEKGDEIEIDYVDMKELKNSMADLRVNYIPSLKDYQMLMKLCIANYKAQAKRSYQKGKLIATRAEKVKGAAIIEAILPEAYKIHIDSIDKYQADGALTQELIDITNEYNELVTMNQIEQMREENAKNLMMKFNDMKIRLTMKP